MKYGNIFYILLNFIIFQIFLLTDGKVGNTDDVVSLVRKNNGNTR